MKQKSVFILLAAIFSGSVFAQSPVSSKIINGPDFEELIVSGPVTVEFIESETASVEAVGSYDFVNSISVTWSKKQLHIVYFMNQKKTDPVIKVYAKNLKSIIVEEGAKINTASPLRSDVLLNVLGESTARITTRGKIRIVNPESVNVQRISGKE